MKFDIFLSICQTEVDGYIPSEKTMWENFFEQLKLADALGFGTAWIAETHLSCQIQKRNPGAVIPHFKGEIGLNTDILQLAHKAFGMTKRIALGSAIRNIQCNGGPIAHAEALRTFLSLHSIDPTETRKLHLGFASGRFPFSNAPYGIVPRDAVEKAAWKALRGKIFQEAVEIFLRFVRGDIFSAKDVRPTVLRRPDFRSDEDWAAVLEAYGETVDEVPIANRWSFEQVGVIPFEAPMHLLQLVIGAHDFPTQAYANTFLPCWVFNLSITPREKIEETHRKMAEAYHADGGPWQRSYMPRTTLVVLDDTPGKTEDEKNALAHERATKIYNNYWMAMAGTLDPDKVAQAVDNALVGSPDTISRQMEERFDAGDRLMLWFDFNDHDSPAVCGRMETFMEKVAPRFQA